MDNDSPHASSLDYKESTKATTATSLNNTNYGLKSSTMNVYEHFFAVPCKTTVRCLKNGNHGGHFLKKLISCLPLCPIFSFERVLQPATHVFLLRDKLITQGENANHYTTQAVRGPITKINQSKCSIAGVIISLSRMIPHLCLCFLQSGNKSFFNQACSGPYWENIGLRSYLNGPRCARSILSRPRAEILPVRPSRLVNKIHIYRPKLCNEAVLRDKLRVFVSRISPPLNSLNK